MARDRGLEELIRERLDGMPGIVETTMFGGRAWLLHGHLVCGARDDGMLARLGRDRDGWALALPGVAVMTSGARPMRGWVRATADAFGDDALRERLIEAALAFAGSLPPK